MEKNNLFDSLVVVKRSGQRCEFQGEKIAIAIKKAFDSVENNYFPSDINQIYSKVLKRIEKDYMERKTIKIEDIQDIILDILNHSIYKDVYESFKKYRENRAISRESNASKEQHKFLKSMEKLGLNDHEDPKNIGSHLSSKEMFHNFGSVISKEFTESYLLDHKTVRNLDSGILFLHHLEYYPMGTPCSIQLLFQKNLREEEKEEVLETLMALSRMIRKVFEEQHGNVSIPYFETELSASMVHQFAKIWESTLFLKLSSFGLQGILPMDVFHEKLMNLHSLKINLEDYAFFYQNSRQMEGLFVDSYRESLEVLQETLKKALRWFLEELDFTYERNLKKQKVSLSFGTDESFVGVMISKVLLEILVEVKPISVEGIFKIKKERHFNSKSVLAEVFSLSQKAFYEGIINYELLDTSYNKGKVEVGYGAEGERVYLDTTTQEPILVGEKGSVSYTSINLPRLAFRHQHENDLKSFYEDLKESLEMAKNEILERFEFQCGKHNYNFPFLIQNGIWCFGSSVKETDRLRKVFKHGVLQINFVGLYETVQILLGKNMEKDESAYEFGLEIVKFMRQVLDKYSEENNLNFNLCGNDLEHVTEIFFELDRVIYGKVKTLYDNKYSNSFHLPRTMDLEKRAKLEGKFHSFCNGGHVFYIYKKPKEDLKELLNQFIINDIGFIHYEKEAN